MFKIYYNDLEHIDKVFAPYILTSLKEKKRLQLKVLEEHQSAYKNCYYKITDFIRRKEHRWPLKTINKELESLIDTEFEKLARYIIDITLLCLTETAFIALSPLARIKLDLLTSMSKKGVKARRGESHNAKPQFIGEDDDSYLFLLRSIQQDVLAESDLIASATMSKITRYNNQDFILSKRIWGESMESARIIKELIKEGINVDQAKIAPLLEKYVEYGKDKLVKDYPNLKRRLKNRFPKNTTFNTYRLINNEMSKLFFETSKSEYENNEYVSAVKWLLSNNRNKEDGCECWNYAYNNSYGLGAGVYPPDGVPDRPHVLCQCSIAPISSRRLKKAIEGKENIGNTPSKMWLEEQARLMKKNKEEEAF